MNGLHAGHEDGCPGEYLCEKHHDAFHDEYLKTKEALEVNGEEVKETKH